MNMANVETFQIDGKWFYQYCFPDSEIPITWSNGEPFGPFATEDEALTDAYKDPPVELIKH
jgi:hypothetical protein